MLSSGEPKLSTKAGGLQTQGYERPHTQRCKLYKEVQRLIDRDWDYFENWQTMR